jgi:catechol 2,3-dioxygenase-like lactoylglutathione lyase family enzyme
LFNKNEKKDSWVKIVKGYRHTGIICKDIEKSIVFYRDYLGLEVIQDFWDDSDYMNEITAIKGANVHMIKLKANDGTVVELLDYVTHPTELLWQEIYNVGACHIAFQVYDIEQAYDDLVQKEVKFLSKPILSSEGIAKVCFCMDPNNTRIELVEML